MAGNEAVPESLGAESAQTQMCLKKHRFPQDLAILDELPCFISILELSVKGNPRRLWGSAAWLQHKDQTMAEFTDLELGSSTQHWKSNFYQLGLDTEIERRATDFENTLYPRDNRPRRLLHCCRPIWFQGNQRPSTLLAMFNTDNSSLDTATRGEPLDFHFEGNICKEMHKYPEGLEVLNDVPIFTVLYDLKDAGCPRKLWANSAWLAQIGQTLEEFQSFDLAGNASAGMLEIMQEIGRQVQLERKVISFPHTVYNGNKAIGVVGVLRPVSFEGTDTPLCMCTYLPQDNLENIEDQQHAPFGSKELIWNIARPPSPAVEEIEVVSAESPPNCCQECIEWRQRYQLLEDRKARLQDQLNCANDKIAQAGTLSNHIREELWECCSSIHEMTVEDESEAQSTHTTFTVLLEPPPGGTGRVVELASSRDYAHKKEEMNKLKAELGSLKATLHGSTLSENHLKELRELQEAAARMIEEAREHAEQVAALREELAASRDEERRLGMEVARLQGKLWSAGQVPTPLNRLPVLWMRMYGC
eukprot:470166-Rhodomonas_salina.1